MTGTSNLAAALAAAQGQLTNVGQDGRGNYGKYLTLPKLIDAVRPILAANGLAWSAMPAIGEDGAPTMKYRLMHTSGEVLEGEMALMLTKRDAQGQGSALTYARRYALAAVLNIGADEDDDGQHATNLQREHTRPRSSTPTAPREKPAVSPVNTKILEVIAREQPANDVIRQALIDIGVENVPAVVVKYTDGDARVNPQVLNALSREHATALLRWLEVDDGSQA